MFATIIDSVEGITLETAAICTAVSLGLGLIVSLVYISQGDYTKNFAVTLLLLPTVVQVVIMMVNGNIGTGVAVLGAFSLIRFRSVPGTSREILAIFLAMALGLATGMGYVAFASLMCVVICLIFFLLYKFPYAEWQNKEKRLKITIPENMDYTKVFDEIFKKYLKKSDLEKVKTTNLGTMYELTYVVTLKNVNDEKAFIDEIRCRNGNLTVICGKVNTTKEEL